MFDHFFFKYIKLKANFLELIVLSEFAHRSFRVRSSFTHRSCGKLKGLRDCISTTSRVLTKRKSAQERIWKEQIINKISDWNCKNKRFDKTCFILFAK